MGHAIFEESADASAAWLKELIHDGNPFGQWPKPA
jgi:hypothetical protein